jgi:Base plate wedge protein 53
MTETYFSKFPKINYNGYKSINILARAKILERIYNRNEYYYTIEVPEFVRPDQLSGELYRDPYMSWLFYLANDTVDPYYQWFMDGHTFDQFITTKYGSVQSAQSRVAYWLTNWYDTETNITTSAYNALIDTSKKYYEPVMVGKNVLEYRRKQVDWSVNTNQIWEYTVTGDAQLSLDEKVTLGYNTNVAVSNAQVLFSNSSYVRVQHVFGATNHVTSLVGANNKVSVTVTSANLVATNIPASEQVYWSPVTYYDVEEAKNKNNSSIRALKQEFSRKTALELEKLLNT